MKNKYPGGYKFHDAVRIRKPGTEQWMLMLQEKTVYAVGTWPPKDVILLRTN